MTKSFKVDLTKWLVLDEADRLLDLGFEKAINDIIQLLDEKGSVNRQNILVSATLSDGIERLAALSLKEPVYIGLDKSDDNNNNNSNELTANDQFNTPKQLDQMYVEVETKERLVTLVAFLKWITTSSLMAGNMSKIIIFFSSCDSVEFHHYLFSNVKLEADKTGKIEQKANSIFKDGGTVVGADGNIKKEEVKKLPIFSATLYKLHGDIDQKQRTETFLNFKKAKEGILLTTDVSARGLDLPAVNWIVQYDPCSDTKDYVHRIGRTARLGQQGSALLFLTPQERKYVFHLKKFNIEPEEMKVTTILQSLYHTTEGQLKKTMKTTQLESQVHDLQLTLERFILEDNQGIEMARSAYKSSLRSYATHKANLKYIFHIGSLHLGHVSKSFALRETPSELNKITAKQDKIAKKDEDTKKMKKSTDYKMKNYMETNEFGNGLGAGMANSIDRKRVQTGEFTRTVNKRQRQESSD
ncbi:putative RNA helicase [Heterostelium album PN500]|uniref:ATP-dependent RNA helicase n=1 Tax=Heterostelium pallidum (strain ATCC 26659 / Pp 5 / PN500) TaxID=670386 RepID=D3BG42_HETP5|nr:putative RNA helicase [Heterostelium album PN500]EFA79634.1 putative RNA helicase [Heterostelium album PN500]|eukprot:XP_020431755.1 putative RNA helicase [Heterostelium album PN500]